MFDWISDAIDWIGDGISSLWDSTVGSAVDAITDEIWDIMFNWLFNLIYGAVADLFEFINESTSDIFALSWVQSFISLFHSLAWMLFVCGMLVRYGNCIRIWAGKHQKHLHKRSERVYGGESGDSCSSASVLALRCSSRDFLLRAVRRFHRGNFINCCRHGTFGHSRSCL